MPSNDPVGFARFDSVHHFVKERSSWDFGGLLFNNFSNYREMLASDEFPQLEKLPFNGQNLLVLNISGFSCVKEIRVHTAIVTRIQERSSITCEQYFLTFILHQNVVGAFSHIENMAKGSNDRAGKAMSQPDDSFDNYRRERYAAHMAERQNLSDLAFKTSERYDHWVITLAGGALAVSLTFLEKIAPHPLRSTLVLLGISWSAFILAVLAGFCAIHYSRKAIYRTLEIADAKYNHFVSTSSEQNPAGEAPPMLENQFRSKTECLNKMSLGCLIAGTVFMCIFAMINMTSVPASSNVAKIVAPSASQTSVTNSILNSNSVTNAVQILNTNKVQP